MEDLGDIKLDEAHIEGIIKNLKRPVNDRIKEILKIDAFYEEREEIQITIREARQLGSQEEFLENVLKNLKKSKLKGKVKKSINKEFKNLKQIKERNDIISLKIDKSEALNDMYNHLKHFWILDPILERHINQDYVRGLSEIHLFNDKKEERDALYDAIPLIQELAVEEKQRDLLLNQNHLDRLNRNIEKYQNYMDLRISDTLDLTDIFQEAYGGLFKIREKNLDHILNGIEEEKEEMAKKARQEDEDKGVEKKSEEDYKKAWLDNYQYYLNKYKRARNGRKIRVVEEKKSIKIVIRELMEEEEEMLDTTKRAGLVKPKQILKIISEYKGLYEFEKERRWAEHEMNKYRYLKRK